MADLEAILQLLQKVAADNEEFRQEAARQRKKDQQFIAKQRLLDRQYLDQRLFCLESSFNKSLSDVSAAIGASAVSNSTQSSNVSKRSRASFEQAASPRDSIDAVETWFNGQSQGETGWGEGDSDAQWLADDPDALLIEEPVWAADLLPHTSNSTLQNPKALNSDPPQPGTLQHMQLLSSAAAHPIDLSAVLKVLPSDDPKQCLLCGTTFTIVGSVIYMRSHFCSPDFCAATAKRI
jgi:cell pole-organizing protein PopZ